MWWGWGIKHNDGLAYVPVGEPDAFVCECSCYEPTKEHPQGRTSECSWYSQVSYNLSVLTEISQRRANNSLRTLRRLTGPGLIGVWR